MERNNILFSDIFSVLHDSLSSSSNDNDITNIDDHSINSQSYSNFSSNLRNNASNSIRKNAIQWKSEEISHRIKNVRSMRSAMRSKIRRNMTITKKCLTSMTDINDTSYYKLLIHNEAVQRQLYEQKQNSERRMRELVYEIIGEYGKSHQRVVRRFAYLWQANRVKVNWIIWRQRWYRYLLKLNEELTVKNIISTSSNNNIKSLGLSWNILSPKQDKDEFNSVLQRIVCLQEQYTYINSNNATIIRFNSAKIKANNGSNSRNALKIITGHEELSLIIDELYAWLVSNRAASKPTTGSRHGNTNNGNGFDGNIPSPPPKPQPQSITDINVGRTVSYEFLSSRSIEWLNPAASNPAFWDQLVKRQDNVSHDDPVVEGKGTTAAIAAEVNNTIQKSVVDDFTARYATQFCSSSLCERLYFCLEERMMSLKGQSSFPAQNNQLTLSDDASVEVLEELQSFYTGATSSLSKSNKRSKTSTFMTSAPTKDKDNKSNKSGTSNDSGPNDVKQLRKNLNSGPLDIVSYLDAHRNTHILAQYPDVIKARLSNGDYVHFAVAMKISLAETHEFCRLSLSGDELRSSSKLCSHPYITFLSSSKYAPLNSLYSACWSLPMNTFEVSGSKTTKAVLKPLPNHCMQELLRVELWPQIDNNGSVSKSGAVWGNDEDEIPLPPPVEGEASNGGSNSSSNSSGNPIPSPKTSANLIPDHSRIFNSGSSNLLYHDYILMEHVYEIPRIPEETSTTKTSNYSSKNDKLSKLARGTRSSSSSSVSSNKEKVFEGSNNASASSGNSSSQSATPSKSNFYLIQIPKDHNNGLGNDNIDSIDNSNSNATVYAQDESTLGEIIEAYNSGACSIIRGLKEKVIEDLTDPSLKKWDSSILSNVCRWRACMCDATSEPSPKYLCAYHTMMKSYLDLKSSSSKGGGESAKYLPRKHPPLVSLVVPDRDMIMIRSASTLLQELWEGKLRGTLKSFSRKVCEELLTRRRLGVIISRERERMTKKHQSQNLLQNGMISPKYLSHDFNKPKWGRWKDKDKLEEITNLYVIASEYFLKMTQVEKAITTEVRNFERLGIYPSAELAIIRKDLKNFKERELQIRSEEPENSAAGVNETNRDWLDENLLRHELRMSEKKYDLLQRRRQDDDLSRATSERKVAKAKALEELQARDPANFANQSKRF